MNERNPADPIVKLQGISRSFDDVVAVDNIDLDIERGEFISFLGPSGCGKTTLLRIIAGFESADSGTVVLNGRDVTELAPEKRPLNMVFQRYALFPHLTVEENVGFGLRLEGRSKSEIGSRVAELLDLVQLGHCAGRRTHQISGGQAQRIALARALARDPEVLLLDEPLSALDRAVRRNLQDQLKRIQAEVGTTFVYVTHDQEEAMAMSTRIALMEHGRISQLAEPGDLYRAPSTTFAASFVGDANILDCTAEPAEGETSTLVWRGGQLGSRPLNGRGSGDLRIMVRPEDVKLSTVEADSTPVIHGNVVASTFHGFYWMYDVDVDGEELVAREISDAPSHRVGQAVAISVDLTRATVLPDREEVTTDER